MIPLLSEVCDILSIDDILSFPVFIDMLLPLWWVLIIFLSLCMDICLEDVPDILSILSAFETALDKATAMTPATNATIFLDVGFVID